MLHSCVPYDVIMGLQEPGEYEIINLDCGYARAQRAGKEWVVFSLASTDPRAYLRPEWAPGAKISKPSETEGFPFFALRGVERPHGGAEPADGGNSEEQEIPSDGTDV